MISHWKEEVLPDLIFEKLSQKQGWTVSCSLQIGRLSFLLFVKEECLGFYQITFQLYKRVEPFIIRARGYLDLGTCGLRMRALCKGCDLGGN